MFSLTRLKGGMLRYVYDCGPDMTFNFHMLCEVGEPYQQQFIDEIIRRGWKVETRELNQAPWMADFVTNFRGES